MRVLSLLLHDVYERDASESGFAGPGADRYKLSVAELEAQLAAVGRVRRDRPILLSEPPTGAGATIPFAITVDDGGLSYYTAVADRLEARGWRGHCLVTTGFIGRRGFLDARHLRELRARGHVIGTHSVSHPPRFAACTRAQMLREWSDSRKTLQDILGEDVNVGSIPGGYFSRDVARAADAAGLKVLFTSEAHTRVRRIGGCRLIGRFAVRAGDRPEFSARLANLERFTLWREWAVWNGKKAAKFVLGADYPRLVEWAIRAGR
ncbi:MAG: polysaccharide deacetylase family protein [Sulfurifustis sp.]